jgi:hypothetical protein
MPMRASTVSHRSAKKFGIQTWSPCSLAAGAVGAGAAGSDAVGTDVQLTALSSAMHRKRFISLLH